MSMGPRTGGVIFSIEKMIDWPQISWGHFFYIEKIPWTLGQTGAFFLLKKIHGPQYCLGHFFIRKNSMKPTGLLRLYFSIEKVPYILGLLRSYFSIEKNPWTPALFPIQKNSLTTRNRFLPLKKITYVDKNSAIPQKYLQRLFYLLI